MSPPPTSIDGTDITGATIDGQDVQEITVDGQTVFQASQIPASITDEWPHDDGSGNLVTNKRGSIDLELNGATYVGGSNFVGGHAVSYDGTDDFLVSSSRGDFNTTKFSLAGWVKINSSDDDPVLFDTTGSSKGSTQDEGGMTIDFRTSGGTVDLRLQHIDSSGSFTKIFTRGEESVDAGEWYFYGYTANGDFGRLQVWETEANGGTRTIDNSGTAPRGDIGNNKFIHSMGRTDFNRFADGQTDVWFGASGTELTTAELDGIRAETDSGR